MKDFKSLPNYGNRSKKFVNRGKMNNRVAILNAKQTMALNTAILVFVPNEPCPPASTTYKWFKSVPSEYIKPINGNRYGYWRVISNKKPRRNSLCTCNSGLKYKKCCGKDKY